jgi:hypothetical protein
MLDNGSKLKLALTGALVAHTTLIAPQQARAGCSLVATGCLDRYCSLDNKIGFAEWYCDGGGGLETLTSCICG